MELKLCARTNVKYFLGAIRPKQEAVVMEIEKWWRRNHLISASTVKLPHNFETADPLIPVIW